MKQLVIDLKQAIAEYNFSASRHLLERARKSDQLTSIAQIFEEEYGQAPHHTLELRDHVTNYLGAWDVYFAIQMSSVQMLRLLADNSLTDAAAFMLDYIRLLLDNEDSRFDQFYVSVETISKSPYAVILPQILTHRSDELENCTIYYRTGDIPMYCTANLLRTYYGSKIVSAILDDNVFNSIVNEKVFMKIEESLKTAGLNVEEMLVPVGSSDWEETTCNAMKVEAPQEESKELGTLHRVYSARTELFLESFRKQAAALETIQNAKTQLCNDVLITVASDPNHEMQLRALKALGESGDPTVLDFLSRMIQVEDSSVRNVAVRAFSILSSHSKWTSAGYGITSAQKSSSILSMAKVNRILNTLLAKGMPNEMIEDTVIAIAAQGGRNAANMLTRLLAKPQLRVQIAVIKASRLLDRENAAIVIRAALKIDSPDLTDFVEKEIDARWPDEVWK